MSDDEEIAFDDQAAELRYWRALARDRRHELEDLKLAFAEIQATSKELEEEMEKDLIATEKRETALKADNDKLRADIDIWKTRHQAALKEQSNTLQHMQKELEGLRSSEKQLRAKLRDMELDNDDLEKSERAISSTLTDLENRYNKAVERTALLEEELVDKAVLVEELQRVKDELKENLEELGVLRGERTEAIATIDNLQAQMQQNSPRAHEKSQDYQQKASMLDLQHSVAPSPDIDTEGYTYPHNGTTVAGDGITTKDALTLTDERNSHLCSDVAEVGHTEKSETTSQWALARSAQVRDLSSLARKSLTPKTSRDKRSEGVINDMRDMSTRMDNLRQQLTTRRESVLARSSIPRPSTSTLPTSPSKFGHSNSTYSSHSSFATSSRSASLLDINAAYSPTKASASTPCPDPECNLSPRPRLRYSLDPSRPKKLASKPTTYAAATPSDSTRPKSRLSGIGSFRPTTPSAGYSNSRPGGQIATDARTTSTASSHRAARSRPQSSQQHRNPIDPKAVATKNTAKPLPAWR